MNPLVIFSIVTVFAFPAVAKTPAQCDVIYLHYLSSGTNIKYCTLRYVDDSIQIVYWVITDCHTYSDAQKYCAIGGGTLAAFPEVDDKWYMQRFMSPFIVGYGHTYNCGYANSVYMYGTWVGLSLVPGSTTEWVWSDGTKQAATDIRFNDGVTYDGRTNRASAGNCGLAASTSISMANTEYETYRSGFYAAACTTTATAICMKNLS